MDTPIIIEHVYNASPEDVWRAITDPGKMKDWYFDIHPFKAEAGFKFSFYEPGGEKKFLHRCEITEVVPGKKISYTWKYDTDPAITLVSFELSPEENGTRIRLTHTGTEKFSPDNADLKKENFIKGWTEIIGENLKKFLEN